MLNDENYLNSSSFYSGDWNSFVDTINLKGNQQFDYILTSETIYNRNSYEKLHNTFQHLLKKDGVMYPFQIKKKQLLQYSGFIFLIF